MSTGVSPSIPARSNALQLRNQDIIDASLRTVRSPKLKQGS